MSDSNKKLSMIINPCAGTKRIRNVLVDVLNKFNRAGYECITYITAAHGDATGYAASHCGNSDLVVCSGGDGTLNEVINGLRQGGIDVPIGYIPAGSTNDFANSLSISSDIMTAVDDIINGKPQTYDLGLIDNSYFSYVVSVGAFTKTTYTTPQNLKNILGHAAYVLEGIKDLASISPMHLKLDCAEGKQFEGDYIFGAVCNSTSLGGVLTLDPNVVDMNDGLFELLFIRSPKNLDELLRITNALTRKKYDCELLDFVSTSGVTVTCDHPLDWTLDGELCSCGETAVISNIRDAVRIMVNK